MNFDFYIKKFEKRHFDIKSECLYVLISPLNFFDCISKLNKKIKSSNSLLVCLEYQNNLFEYSSKNKIDDIVFIPYKDIDKIKIWFLQNIKFEFKNIFFLNTGINIIKNKAKNDELLSFLNYKISLYWKNKLTIMEFGALWVKNIFFNLESKPFDICTLKTDKPVVVFGAGQSIENSIDFVKKNRSNLFLVCSDTALKILKDFDIKVDLVVILESQFVNSYDFVACNNYDMVAYDLSSYHILNRKFKKPNYVFLSQFVKDNFLNEIIKQTEIKTILPPLGNVGALSVFLASKITNNKIFISGIDYCYYSLSHHKYSVSITNRLFSSCRTSSVFSISQNDFYVHDKNQTYCLTSKIMFNYYEIFLDMIKNIKNVFDLRDIGLDFKLYPDKEELTFENISFENKNLHFELSNKYLDYLEDEILSLKSKIINFINNNENFDQYILEKLNNELGILCFHFPDKVNSRRDFLKRVLKIQDFYLILLKKAKNINNI